MGKRSDFARRDRDYYATPLLPVKPLIPFLLGSTYIEPCVGGGDLVAAINSLTFRLPDSMRPTCICGYDIHPDTQALRLNVPVLPVYLRDSSTLLPANVAGADMLVSNPPFMWDLLRKLLDCWIDLKPTALLLPSDMSHNLRTADYMAYCSDLIPIGRISWIGNQQSGMENYAWYIFDAAWHGRYTRLHRRLP